MPIERSSKHPPSSRLAAVAGHLLLDETKLCAIATVSPDGRPHINTAYFAGE